MGSPTFEIHQPGRAAERITLDRPMEVGRECDGLNIDDGRVSRRHLLVEPHDGAVVVRDLGSTNGTTVNGTRIDEPMVIRPGDVVRFGHTELRVVEEAQVAAVPDMPVPRPRRSRTTSNGAARPNVEQAPAAATRPALEELAAIENEAAIVRFRPGSPSSVAAPAVAEAARIARRNVGGLGSEPWGARPQICVVDPFPDPDHPGAFVAGGTVLDVERGEIWMVVTPESPPEPLERAFALLFGSAYPAGPGLVPLLEAFGLAQAGVPDPDPVLSTMPLPPLGIADGELGAAMHVSFVSYLIRRGGRDAFLRLLGSLRPEDPDAAARATFGATIAELEQAWLEDLAGRVMRVPTGQFARLTLRYLRPMMGRQVELFVHMLLGMVFTIAFAKVFESLVNRLSTGTIQFDEVVRTLGVLGVAFAVSMLAGLRRAYVSAFVSSSVIMRVRSEMFDRLQVLSSRWFHRHEQGDVMARMYTDVAVLEQGVSDTFREGFFQLLSIAVYSVVLFTINPLLAVIVITGAPIVALVYKVMGKGAQQRSLAVQEQVGASNSVAIENYLAQPVVKAFSLEEREQSRFRKVSNDLFRAEIRLSLFGGLFGVGVQMVTTILRLAVLGTGAWMILTGRSTIGALSAFMAMMGEVIGPVTGLTSIGQQIQSSTGALARINEVLEAEPDIADAPGAVPLAPLSREVQFVDVAFSYTPERRTLDGLNVTIRAGERVAIVGPTGSGKSSVLQLLMRSYDPDQGAVRIDGHDLRTVTLRSLRDQVGVVFQDTFLFDGTIAENIALGQPGATREQIEQAARDAELHDFVQTLPRGYDSPVGERGSRLSGGQRQRVAIARALIRNPRLLVLDEATSALDPRTERLISDTLDRVAEGRTVVSVTHRLAAITRYDRILVIVAGQLAQQGTHEELLAEGGVYAELWAEQSGGAIAGPAFDAVGALRAVPLFAGLDDAALHSLSLRLRPAELSPGERLAEGGHLVLVKRGRGRVLLPGLRGTPTPVADIGSGGSFGIAALAGDDRGAELEAREPMSLLVLDAATLAAVLPTAETAAALAPAGAVTPAGGRRLSRLTVSRGALPPPAVETAAAEARRLSGALPAVVS